MQSLIVSLENRSFLIDRDIISTQSTVFDDFFYSTELYEIFIQGVITNKAELLQAYQMKNFIKDFSAKLYSDKLILKQLRGSFYGYIYDKGANCIYIFNDHLGTKNIYYKVGKSKIIVSNYFNSFYTESPKLSASSVKMLLSYGYMLDDYTILEDVKKLKPGSIIKVNLDCEIEVEQYYKLSSKKIAIDDFSEDEIISRLDFLFRNAVTRQFEADVQLGKRHLVGLSGGLDSRMTSMVANEMGYKNQMNFTFSQSDYLDELIPKKISSDLRHEWIFKSLDNGIFLKDIDFITSISGGNVLYFGLAHTNSLMKVLNFQNFGIIHTGQLGDVVIGSFISSLDRSELNSLGGAYSKKGINLVGIDRKFDSFEEKEIEMFYQRGLNGANSGLITSNYYAETLSPFYDIDLLDYCFSIPISLRMDHRLYRKWILKMYPKAANYVWEKTGRNLKSEPFYISILGRKIPIKDVVPIIFKKIFNKNRKLPTKDNMNPIEYWYHTNSDLREFKDNYYCNYIDKVEDVELRSICKELYINGNAIEKNQVLSFLSVIKNYF
ncbi:MULTISPECIES: asparagine synthase [unclassified Sphingobacterium]|uniref:asparagine synthase n=1 Tax=unclassified Sphingobacterium TaxID=2609468 RepID=UPI00104D4B82|nr:MULTISPECIES: asparagine synthase [unclassified Sphingobacterium]MCS3555820.1 asparagine synthase (glutamine-hydrolyzing) [Sphingobacterium sp. JUb21]TCR00727.1 asparagine synthase (glutamine-hydrolysing) [Sphingobacterium sp. JUb20]